MGKKKGARKEDRRTVYTKNAIKDSMLELLAEQAFEKITVAAICRRAEIVRTTFYLHYEGLTDVIRELADDAILAVPGTGKADIQSQLLLTQKMKETTDPEELAPYMSLLPVCHRVADDPKYRVMFRDPMVSEYIRMQIYRRQKDASIENFKTSLGLTEKQAEKLFLFVVTGAFEVNRSMGWEKNQDWYEVLRVLMIYMGGGYDALAKLTGKQPDTQ